ncbi:MAG: histidine phosphatase family protein [Clostridia bacterium]|nr:histidine phosphatase family protein [Clostridia bacterium]
MQIYFIRHGESEGNKNNTHAGWAPIDLTEKGRQQAAMARELVKGIAFDAVFVSDVKRAQQTASIVFPNARYTYVPLMREMNNTTMRGKTREEMYALCGEKYLACRRAFDYAPLNMDCESGAHLKQRAGELLRFFEAQKVETAAAVCHAGLIRACAAFILNTPDHNPPLYCDNASVCVIEQYKGRWHIRSWNVTPFE